MLVLLSRLSLKVFFVSYPSSKKAFPEVVKVESDFLCLALRSKKNFHFQSIIFLISFAHHLRLDATIFARMASCFLIRVDNKGSAPR